VRKTASKSVPALVNIFFAGYSGKMLEILFGPDGVGKTTIAATRKQANPETITLHGTNTRHWFEDYPDLMRKLGFRASFPPDRHIHANARRVTAVSLALSKELPVVIDEHCLYRTLISGRHARMPGAGTEASINTLVTTHFAPYFKGILADNIQHTHVVLGPTYQRGDYAASELQRRINSRDKPILGEASTVDESLAQLERSYQLEEVLIQRGAVVASAIATLPDVLRVQGETGELG
jgi:hypothetical protein